MLIQRAALDQCTEVLLERNRPGGQGTTGPNRDRGPAGGAGRTEDPAKELELSAQPVSQSVHPASA